VSAALVCALAVTSSAFAQGAVSVNSAAGLHEVLFQMPQGGVGLLVAGDAAPGDAVAGIVRVQAAGSSAAEQERNLRELNGLIVEWQGQRGTPVSDHHYRTSIPATLRTGRVSVRLRTNDGRTIAEATVPIDGMPAPALPPRAGPPRFDLPTEAQAGGSAVIRGPFDGALAGKTVRLGAATPDLLAVSPRRLVFEIPTDAVGETPLQFAAGANSSQGTIRVFSFDANVTKRDLRAGEKATMTVRVKGLRNIAAPVMVIIRNGSPQALTIEGGSLQALTIAPKDVAADGTASVSREVTGGGRGPLDVGVLVSGSPIAAFDIARATAAALATWEAATGIRIAAEGRDRILRSIREAQPALERFLLQQLADYGDPRDIFAALVSDYCFDLRDGKPRGAPRATSKRSEPEIRSVALTQAPAGAASVELDANDVQRLSFGDFLARLVERFSASQPIGYLLITSKPASASITIDGQRKNEMTNRRFVTSTGEHAIVITGGSKTCQQRVQVGAFQITVVVCEP
jgi:hypothetical protein